MRRQAPVSTSQYEPTSISASQRQRQSSSPSSGSASQRQQRQPTPASASLRQSTPARISLRQPASARPASAKASQPGQPRQTDRYREASQPSRRPGSSELTASPLTREVGSQPEHAIGQPADRRVVLRGVALLYESPGGNQVDGLPPIST